MTVLAMIRMTTAQKDSAMLLNDSNQAINPRQIDNPLANALGEGVIVGDWLITARTLIDPEYVRWVPEVEGYPIRVIDSDVMFLPPPPEE
jgi:hypothetical protein